MTTITEAENEAPPAAPLTIAAVTLRKMLAAVLPHADENDTFPALNGVLFEISGGTLFLVATDRHTLGVARYRAPEGTIRDARAAVLPLACARLLQNMLREDELAADPPIAAVTLLPGKLSVDCGNGMAATWATADASVMGKAVDWRQPIAPVLNGEAVAPGDACGWNPGFLARFKTLRKSCVAGPVVIRFAIDSRSFPVLYVFGGDWFLGAVMAALPGRAGVDRAPDVRKRWAEALDLGVQAADAPVASEVPAGTEAAS